MKKISEIRIKNYRAYISESIIKLPKGENLLIYGENGSGKSSLYKGLNAFVQSFVAPSIFEKNRYNDDVDGYVQVDFKEFDTVTNSLIDENTEHLSFYDGVNNISIENTGYLKAAALTKGFLDYKDLLRVYLHDNKNLFDLIVTNVLRNHFIGHSRIGDMWEEIKKDFWNTSRRTKKSHRSVPDRLLNFKTGLESLLTNLTPVINNFLSNYFEEFKVSIGFDLVRLECSDVGEKSNWNIISELFLIVRSDGEEIANYEEFLNEARLSAISICIFLASLKANESQYYKILFLDDVFIGLDAGNRKPVLSILTDYFSDYQLVISTYDRHWFNVAQKYLSVKMPNRWKSYYLYSGTIKIGNPIIERKNPIVVEGESDLEKGIQYLHHCTKPDYFAAANYFRKATENILSRCLPLQEFTKDEMEFLESYQLTERIKRGRVFLRNINSTYTGLDDIHSHITSLLHPLSHYNVDEQIYKSELVDVERILLRMEENLKNIKSSYKIIISKDTKIWLNFKNADSSYTCFYVLIMLDNVYLYRKNDESYNLTDARCQALCAKDNLNNSSNLKSINLYYTSISDARINILKRLNDEEHREIIVNTGFEGIEIKEGDSKRKLTDVVTEIASLF